MTLRTATVCLVAAVLLVCPYICLSNAAAGTGASSMRGHRSGGCDCCSHSAPPDSKDCPSQPNSRQGSGTCLCHGAVIAQHVLPPSPDNAVVTFLPLEAVLLVQASSAVERGLLTDQAACHFPIADSGREVRALIESLLV